MGNCKSTPSTPTVTSLGFTYNSTNAVTNSNLQALAGIMTNVQQAYCKKQGNKMLEIINKIPVGKTSGKPASVVKNKMIALVKIMIDSNKQMESDEKTLLISSLTNLITVSVNNATTDDKVDSTKFKQNLINMVLAICPSASSELSELSELSEPSISNFGSMRSGTNLYIIIAIIVAIVGFYFYKKKNSAFGKRRR